MQLYRYHSLKVFGISSTVFALLMVSALTALADDSTHNGESPKARLAPFEKSLGAVTQKVRLAPIYLDGGSELSVISPKQWIPQAEQIVTTLKETHQRMQGLFGDIPQFRTAIQLMDEDTFFLATGAPRWTNAMYYKEQIVIPMSSTENIDSENLQRSIRHEYTHAVIHALTNGNCPGWLDEGLAQWAEGEVNPALYKALNNWLGKNAAIPLGMLQGGFTKLDPRMVPAAYAQSLVTTSAVLSGFGFVRLRDFFDELKKGTDRNIAFQRSFGASEDSIERSFACVLRHPQCITDSTLGACVSCFENTQTLAFDINKALSVN